MWETWVWEEIFFLLVSNSDIMSIIFRITSKWAWFLSTNILCLSSSQGVTIPHKPVSLHPLYQTRLYPPAKSLLHPQTLSHAECLTPGPFSHLSSFSLTDEQENSHTPFSHNVYNKVRILCWNGNYSVLWTFFMLNF